MALEAVIRRLCNVNLDILFNYFRENNLFYLLDKEIYFFLILLSCKNVRYILFFHPYIYIYIMGRLQRTNHFSNKAPVQKEEKISQETSTLPLSFNPLPADTTWDTYLSRVGGFIPILIVCYNNGWMVHRTVMDLYMKFENLQYVVVDNGSTSEETLNILVELESLEKVRVVRLQENHGPYIVYRHPLLTEYRQHPYLITDPDLDLSRLPEDALEVFYRVGNAYRAHKTGPALDISPHNTLIHDSRIEGASKILDTERGYWNERLSVFVEGFPPEYYRAPIDTTFCFIFPENEGPESERPHIRVAGSYTVFHLPWIKEYIDGLTSNEYDDYFLRNDGKSTVSQVVRRYRRC